MATWTLRPDVTFLNHGSFGAVPLELQRLQEALRAEMEEEPVDFLVRRLPERIHGARAAAGALLGARPQDLVFVPNATAGVNAVLQSLSFEPGDELLTTSHVYNAVRNAMKREASRHGALYREAPLPYPLERPEQITEAVAAAITPRTRLLVVDHISSPSALIFPVQELVALARRHGLLILIDGAHVPGHIPVDLEALGADWWVGNLHKWLCTPRGTALLWTRSPHQERTKPTVISHGYGMGYTEEFDWPGTFDPTGWLCVPEAVRLFHERGGFDFMARGHALVQGARAELARSAGGRLPHPDDPALYGNMAALLLPLPAEQGPILHQRLRERGVEVPVPVLGPQVILRISGFAGYNRPEHYARLAALLPELLRS